MERSSWCFFDIVLCYVRHVIFSWRRSAAALSLLTCVASGLEHSIGGRVKALMLFYRVS